MSDNNTQRRAQSGPAPVGAAQRIVALDVTRGCAVLGILLLNIWSFAGPQAFFDYPPLVADRPGASLATWAVVHTLFEGSQRALFSILFGAGMLLLVDRLQVLTPAVPVGRIYYRRIAILLAIGLFDAFVLLWPADILLVYGWCGLLLYPLRRLSARAFLLLGVAVMVLAALLRMADWNEAAELQREYQAAESSPAGSGAMAPERLRDWEIRLQRAHPSLDDGRIEKSIAIISEGSFKEFYLERAKASLILQTVVAFNSWFLDALAAMLIGMFLLRSGVLTLDVPARSVMWLGAAGYAIGLPLAVWETVTLIGSDFDPVLKARHLIHYDVRRIAMAFGHLALILMLCRAMPHGWLAHRLAAVGRMALSNYLAQSVIGGFIFYSVGLGLYGRFTGYYLYIVVGLIWALQLAVSWRWLERFRFGPCEWLWRTLTYGRRQPFLRRAVAAPA